MRVSIATAVLVSGCLIEPTTFTPLGDDAGTGDTPSVPQLRFPMNDAYVGVITATNSLRPTFVWEPSTGPEGEAITYELEYSRDGTFETGVTSVSTADTSHWPSDPLDVLFIQPVGARHYWRVRACAADVCSAFSRPWWVNIGRSPQDFDGDGLADMLVGAPGTDTAGDNSGIAWLVYGRTDGSFGPNDGEYGPAAGDYFGGVLAFAGDVNADGYADAVISATQAGTMDRGSAYVFLGGPTGRFDVRFELTGEADRDYFGTAAASAGDVNGDGFSDVIIGTPLVDRDLATMDAGRAYLFFGGPGVAFDTTADATITGAAIEDFFGKGAAGAGDVNGDGFADVVVGAYGNDTGGSMAGRAYIYLGGDGPFDTEADGMLTGSTAGDWLGWSVATAGDVNGDGFADVVVGAPDAESAAANGGGMAQVYFGSLTGVDETPEAILRGAAGDHLGFSVSSAGDTNRDGFADVIIGMSAADVGRAEVYFGAPGDTFDATVDGALRGEATSELFGISASGAGDVNADGFADVIVGATGFFVSSVGAAYIFFGGVGETFDETFDGNMIGYAAGDQFGLSVD